MELPLIELPEVMQELERLGDERTKRIYMNHGAREPLFGVTVKALKPLAKKIRKDQRLAEQLYATGNYDAMYLAGMIADAKAMTEEDFDRWIDQAYFYMISDYIVAVTLAETDFAQRVADRWIASGEDLKMSAGWSCYAWLLGWRPDSDFNTEKLRAMLETVTQTIHSQPPRTRLHERLPDCGGHVAQAPTRGGREGGGPGGPGEGGHARHQVQCAPGQQR